MSEETLGCAQQIDNLGTYNLCGRVCESTHSKKLRDLGLPASRKKFCSGHLRLRHLYGKDSPDTMRPITEKKAVAGEIKP